MIDTCELSSEDSHCLFRFVSLQRSHDVPFAVRPASKLHRLLCHAWPSSCIGALWGRELPSLWIQLFISFFLHFFFFYIFLLFSYWLSSFLNFKGLDLCNFLLFSWLWFPGTEKQHRTNHYTPVSSSLLMTRTTREEEKDSNYQVWEKISEHDSWQSLLFSLVSGHL